MNSKPFSLSEGYDMSPFVEAIVDLFLDDLTSDNYDCCISINCVDCPVFKFSKENIHPSVFCESIGISYRDTFKRWLSEHLDEFILTPKAKK